MTGEARSASQESALGRVDKIVGSRAVNRLFFSNFFHEPGYNWSVFDKTKVLRVMRRTVLWCATIMEAFHCGRKVPQDMRKGVEGGDKGRKQW